MNRFFTFLLLFLVLSSSIIAQEVYYEDFNNGMPADYIIIDRDGNTPHANVGFVDNAWVVTASMTAISTSWYSPAGTSDDWMITPEITIPMADADKTLLLTWSELAPDPDYPDGYELKINTTGQTEPDSFTTILSVPSASTDWSTQVVDFSAYQGMTIRLAYVNNSTDKYILRIDDIAIRGYGTNDLAAFSNPNPNYALATNKLSLTVASLGMADVTSCDLSYAIDGNTPITENVSISGLSLLGTKTIQHPTVPTWSAGLHSVTMWVSNVNGGTDTNLANDSLTFDVVAYDASSYTDRNTVLEVFTSSTCGPCKPGNEKIKTVVANLAVKPVLLKYQQDFPSTGDPYATSETIARRNHYNVNAIPTTQIDGLYKTLNPGSLVASDITNAQAIGALIDVEASYQLDSANQSIHVYGSYTPKVNLVDGTKMILAIKELTTAKNVKSNGETSFDNVVKKLYNGTDGIDLSGKEAGTSYPFDYTYQFPGNYRLPTNGQAANIIDLNSEHSVENFSNLAASIIFESTKDSYILQAIESSFVVVGINELTKLEQLSTYPNPTSDFLNVEFSTTEKMPITIQVIDFSGKVLISENLGTLSKGNYKHTLDLADLANGNYDITISSGSTGTSTSFTVVK